MTSAQATLAVGQVTFLFFSTVILLMQWNTGLQWVRWNDGHSLLRKAAHLPGIFFFSSLVSTNLAFALSGGLPYSWMGWWMFIASTLLLGYQVHSFVWLGFVLQEGLTADRRPHSIMTPQ
jgi:hypothetical protein